MSDHTKEPQFSNSIVDSDNLPPQLYPDVIWLIRLRWIAIVGVLVAVVLARYLGVLESTLPILIVVGAMGAFNLGLWWWFRDHRKRAAERSNEKQAVLQLIFDLSALTVLLHFSGGPENPFSMFYAFHVAIGAVFLRRKMVWLLGLLAASLHVWLVVGEVLGIVPHYPLTFNDVSDLRHAAPQTLHNMHLAPVFVFTYLSAFVLMLAGIIYLVQTVAERQRLADAMAQEHKRVALSRERLARIGEISAGLVHTIGNPLHGVINASEILRKKFEPIDDTARNMFDLMSDGLGRIERVTHRLLTLTRDAPLKVVTKDVRALLEETLQFVEPRAREANIRLTLELQPTPPIPLDPDRLFDALINLLDNALAACEAGGTITVKTARVRSPGNGVCIWIEDTGVGISARNLRSVVDPFFTTKPVGEGSGLGLAIANRIVEEHGGNLTLESVVGEGTKVRIFLRAAP